MHRRLQAGIAGQKGAAHCLLHRRSSKILGPLTIVVGCEA